MSQERDRHIQQSPLSGLLSDSSPGTPDSKSNLGPTYVDHDRTLSMPPTREALYDLAACTVRVLYGLNERVSGIKASIEQLRLRLDEEGPPNIDKIRERWIQTNVKFLQIFLEDKQEAFSFLPTLSLKEIDVLREKLINYESDGLAIGIEHSVLYANLAGYYKSLSMRAPDRPLGIKPGLKRLSAFYEKKAEGHSGESK